MTVSAWSLIFRMVVASFKKNEASTRLLLLVSFCLCLLPVNHLHAGLPVWQASERQGNLSTMQKRVFYPGSSPPLLPSPHSWNGGSSLGATCWAWGPYNEALIPHQESKAWGLQAAAPSPLVLQHVLSSLHLERSFCYPKNIHIQILP